MGFHTEIVRGGMKGLPIHHAYGQSRSHQTHLSAISHVLLSHPTSVLLATLQLYILLGIFREIETGDVARVAIVGCDPCLSSTDL